MSSEQDTIYFGKTDFRGRDRVFGIKHLDRQQHFYVMGQTGTGKSTLLKNMALQDIKAGHGLCIVDPHGEFVEDVLAMIPPERIDDVIYFNPADSGYPIGFNVLEAPDPEYKHLAASSLMGIFTKIWANVWSARMEYILNNAVLALLDTPGTTLLGIPRILVDKAYRKQILENVHDPVVRAFWVQEYEQYDPRFRNEAIAPIQNKVGQFLSSGMIRNIVGQEKSTINVYDIMNDQKILLVNVSKGRIGEDNSQLLGAMIITKIQLAAMERIRIGESGRKDFYLYVDEFQNFATDSFASILSEARKYRLNLVIAHQYIGQLVTDTNTRVRDAVFGNVGTMVLFRVGATDAEFLENEFSPEFTLQDLVNLPNRHIYVRLMVDHVRSRPFSATTIPPLLLDVKENTVEQIIDQSRKLYTRPRKMVEEEVNTWSGFGRMEDDGSKGDSIRQRSDAPSPPPSVRDGQLVPPRPYRSPGSSSFGRNTSHPEGLRYRHEEPPHRDQSFVSLSELRGRSKSERRPSTADHPASSAPRRGEKKEANLSALREALQESLKKQSRREEESPRHSGGNGQGSLLEPGKSVKL